MNKIYTSYSPTAKNRLYNCKKNVIHIGRHDTIKHELAKAIGAIMLSRYGDVKFDKILKEEIKNMSAQIEFLFKDWEEDHTDFITEAWKNEKRRVDLVNLKTGDEIEFETSKSVKKPDATTIYI